MDDLLTISDLAGLLKVHRRTVERMVVAGELPAPLRLVGEPRWRRATWRAWLKTLDGKPMRKTRPPAASEVRDLRGLAALLRVHRRTIERWISRRLLPPCTRINGRRYWRVREVLEKFQSAATTENAAE